ncbi:MAG: TatD family hydrolase, partial [Candidatus Magasanikbacteria bacterium]|nr:TatD family hydrolase [Candidatus Magasanikbacteria bacterium]
MLFDTHCHIQFQAYKNDRLEVIKRCQEKGLILNIVGTQRDTSRLAVELAEQYDGMYASIGTHPIHLHPTHVDEEETHFMSREENFDAAFYTELAKSKKVIGVGECGLDLWHVPRDVPVEQVLEKQKRVFLDHLRFAARHDLALIIHCREAHDQLLELLKTELGAGKRQLRGVVHCYTSHWRHAEQYLDLGLYLGLTGVVTFPPRK